jgi:hypothetical protein
MGSEKKQETNEIKVVDQLSALSNVDAVNTATDDIKVAKNEIIDLTKLSEELLLKNDELEKEKNSLELEKKQLQE